MSKKVTITMDLHTLGRVLIALVFIWAALSKLANPTEFLGALYAYQLPLAKSLLQLVAVILPWFEFLCGLLLLLNVWTESALAGAEFLLVVFLIATGQAWIRGLHISCGCFDLTAFGLRRGHPLVDLVEGVGFAFLRNLVLTAIVVALFRQRLEDLRSVTGPPPLPGKPAQRPQPA